MLDFATREQNLSPNDMSSNVYAAYFHSYFAYYFAYFALCGFLKSRDRNAWGGLVSLLREAGVC